MRTGDNGFLLIIFGNLVNGKVVNVLGGFFAPHLRRHPTGGLKGRCTGTDANLHHFPIHDTNGNVHGSQDSPRLFNHPLLHLHRPFPLLFLLFHFFLPIILLVPIALLLALLLRLFMVFLNRLFFRLGLVGIALRITQLRYTTLLLRHHDLRHLHWPRLLRLLLRFRPLRQHFVLRSLLPGLRLARSCHQTVLLRVQRVQFPQRTFEGFDETVSFLLLLSLGFLTRLVLRALIIVLALALAARATLL
mmetsp:Transcript_27741/g.77568  ORF Transcript_27741/g.77568 Transcript_27741/m.77568 type:complete len:247 (-) Transcript_27741:2493-3233(-)